MANNTRQIKRRITASQNISKITKAMEMVAASKMKRAQEQALAARPYSRALQRSLQKVSSHTDSSLHPLLERHQEGKEIAVILSTDKGLCGSMNTILFKALIQWLKKHPNGEVVAVGRKAVMFCRLFGLPLFAQFTNLPDRISIRDILPITTLVVDKFLSGDFKSVHIFYMDFINTLSQKMRTVQLLPLQPETEEAEAETPELSAKSEYIFEPDPKAILSQLLPYYLENTTYQIFLESKASEHSARMVSMKNASENAGELVNELKLIFNKSRQANITSELLDISTAALTIT